MNLVKAQELAKELSIPDLQRYANGSNPDMMPPYIALGALQAKEIAAKKMQSMQGAAQGEQPSVKEQLEQKAGLMALQGQQQQQAQQQMMQQAQSRPMPAPENVPQPEPQPQEEPVGMAAGGIARLPVSFNFRDGGIIGYAGPEGSSVDASGGELDAAKAAKQQALAELRRFGTQQRINNPEGYARAEAAYLEADAREKQAMKRYAGSLEGTSAMRPATSPLAAGQAYKELGIDMQAPAPQQPAPAPQRPALAPADMAMRQAPAGLPAGLPAAMPTAAPRPAPSAGIAAQAMPRPPVQAAPQAPQAPQMSDQEKLIAEEAERRKAFGLDKEIGADAEARMAGRRKQFEETRPSGLDEMIRIFGQSGQYKGLTGLGPAYTAREDQKRAERAAFESKLEEQQAAMENARRTERAGRATGIGEGLGKVRELQQKEAEAKARNLTSLEVARIQSASANRPGETERMMAEYSRLKATNPAAAEQFLQTIGRIRTGSATGKGVMTRNEAIDNVNKLLMDPGNRMDMKKEAAAELGKKDPTFSEILDYFVKQNMGETAQTSPTTPTRLKFDAQGNQIK